jgi:leucyl-tRNA synthetase
MAVPGQDERDWEFAERFGLPIVRTVQPPAGFEGKAYAGEGPAIASPRWDGKGVAAAKKAAIAWLESSRQGRAKVTYKLRDWLFSRQRYWGEPFPILHHADGRVTRVLDEDLPVELPEMEDFTPSADGSPPLARAKGWVGTTDAASGERVRRDTDTMPGWAGSCWYYLRFMDPANERAPFAPEAQRYWGSVDLYVGGVEHAVLHLLYARFWHKVLFDAGLVTTKEPFQRLFNQGLLTAFAYKDARGALVPVDEVEERDGSYRRKASGDPVEQIIAKMSKSLRNVVNPDDVVAEYGVDTFRVYEMFMGPLGDSKPWNPRDVAGSRRFLDRLWRLLVDEDGGPVRSDLRSERGASLTGESLALERALNRALKRIDDSFAGFNFNTAIAAMMEFVNEATRARAALTRSQAERFLCALSPFAPHLAEELWSRLGHAGSIQRAPWPVADPAHLVDDEIDLVVQVNGKLRAKIKVPKDAARGELEARGRAAIEEHLSGRTVRKVVVVPGRLVNFVGD